MTGFPCLWVNEIFLSIQGEGSRAGRVCVFIRLAGCPFRCTYCDTTYAFQEGAWMKPAEVLARVQSLLGSASRGPTAPFVEVTGGEPLAQEATIPLLEALLELGCEVALETSGGMDLAPVPVGIIKIVDRKTPGSGEDDSWMESNLECLTPGQDELKFVLCHEADYHWAVAWCRKRRIWDRLEVIFGAASDCLDARWLAERMAADRIPARFQLQLHKILWDPERRGV